MAARRLLVITAYRGHLFGLPKPSLDRILGSDIERHYSRLTLPLHESGDDADGRYDLGTIPNVDDAEGKYFADPISGVDAEQDQ
jgi:hypothetical protein